MKSILKVLTLIVLAMTEMHISAQNQGWEIKPVEGIRITGTYVSPGDWPMTFSAQTLSLDSIIIYDNEYKQFFKELYRQAWRSEFELFLGFKVFKMLFPNSEQMKNNEIVEKFNFDFASQINEAERRVEIRIGEKDIVYLYYCGIKGLFLCSTDDENIRCYNSSNEPYIFSKIKFKGIAIPIAIYDCFPIDNPFVIMNVDDN